MILVIGNGNRSVSIACSVELRKFLKNPSKFQKTLRHIWSQILGIIKTIVTIFLSQVGAIATDSLY